MEQRLASQEVHFKDPVHRQNLSTFSSKSQRPANAIAAARSADIDLFAQLVVMAQVRTFVMRKLLQHALVAVSWLLANANGQPVATAKSKQTAELEKGVNSLVTTPANAALVVDTVAMVQTFTSVPGTFGKLRLMTLRQLVMYMDKLTVDRLDFVADKYFPLSVKFIECQRRASQVSGRPMGVTVQRPDQPTQKSWKLFLSDSDNKSELIKFMVDYWRSNPDDVISNLLGERELFATAGDLLRHAGYTCIEHIPDRRMFTSTLRTRGGRHQKAFSCITRSAS